jgi:hypothetical protein
MSGERARRAKYHADRFGRHTQSAGDFLRCRLATDCVPQEPAGAHDFVQSLDGLD